MATYSEAGVNIEKGDESVNRIKKHVKSTFNENVLLDSGLFCGAVSLKEIKKLREPVMLASVDGIGTKTIIAKQMDSWDSIGQDLVNHSVNDILCHGGTPIAFLDYIASEKLEPKIIEEIVKGMSIACKENSIALIAGETAEMPGTYKENEVDIAGTIIGITEKNKMITGKKIKEGDVLIGLPSTGLHTNGYSLARKVITDNKMSLKEQFEEEKEDFTLGQLLLKIHKSYLKEVSYLMKKFELKGIAHITGGGIAGNLQRILPQGIGAEVNKQKIIVPFIFKLIQEKGKIFEDEMYKAFNMGIGMILVVSEKDSEKIISELKTKFEMNAVILGKTLKGKEVKLVSPMFDN
ncbi:MAG: phosphoribosylformylglycinamidine cyclo-ligase [Candidatus Micrarchaeota archaeon]